MSDLHGGDPDSIYFAGYFESIWKPKTGKDLSYPLSAKDVCLAIRRSIPPGPIHLSYSQTSPRHWLAEGNSHVILQIVHSLDSSEAAPALSDARPAMGWGISVHAVPRPQKVMVKSLLINDAIPNVVAPWFGTVAKRRDQHNLAILTIVYDEIGKSTTGRSAVKLRPR